MVTKSSNIASDLYNQPDTIMTNKGPKPVAQPQAEAAKPPAPVVPKPKVTSVLLKCTTCDTTLEESDEVCPVCFQLTEDAKTILLD